MDMTIVIRAADNMHSGLPGDERPFLHGNIQVTNIIPVH
jgi:hypothetical protein